MALRTNNLIIEKALQNIRELSQMTDDAQDLSDEGMALRQEIHQAWLSLDPDQRLELERGQGDLLKSLFKPRSNQDPL